nr:H-type lectin domain-containing protein [Paracoccus sp. S1E-3]
MFSAFEDGSEMWTGAGARELRHPVRFQGQYESAPTVHVGLSMWDIDMGSNQRVDIAADNIAASGFTIVFRTWGDTRVARVRADWLAIGPAAYDEDWED